MSSIIVRNGELGMVVEDLQIQKRKDFYHVVMVHITCQIWKKYQKKMMILDG